MKLEGLTFAFLGDSITEGVGTTAPEKRYFELLKNRWGLKEVLGYGISGTRFARQRMPSDPPSFDRFFGSRVEEMAEADGVVVFGGTNDYGHGDAPIGSFDDRTPDTFYGACHSLFSSLIAKYPGKPVVIMTPLHRVGEDTVKDNHGTAVTLRTYVEIIRQVAEYYSLPVCDLFRNSGLQPEVPAVLEGFVPDGLHPNDAGHEILADRLGFFLESL